MDYRWKKTEVEGAVVKIACGWFGGKEGWGGEIDKEKEKKMKGATMEDKKWVKKKEKRKDFFAGEEG